MARALYVCVALLVVACAADALKLPSYIKPCRRDDPNLNECALKNGREAIPGLINGDRKYRIPNLNPLTIYNFNVEGTSSIGLSIALKEAKIPGLDTAQFTGARIDLKKKTMEFDFLIDRAAILGEYDVSGRVLILPITGHGDANITFSKLSLTYKLQYDLEKKKNGKEYIMLKDSKLSFNIERAHFILTNLFNGDRALGENMNHFLNENWREVIKELGPAVADAIKEVIQQILTQIVELVPYDHVFI